MEQIVSLTRRSWGVGLGAGVACLVLACTDIADDAQLSSDGTLTHAGGRPGEPDAGPSGAAGASAGSAGAAGAGSAGASTGGAAGATSGGSSGSAGQAGSAGSGGSTESSGPNLISNPDFELGVAPWSAAFGGTLGLSVEQAHSGTHSGRVTNRTQAYQGAHYDLTNVVTPGAEYAVSAWGRIGNGATSTAPLKLTAQFKCMGLADQYVTLRQVSAASDAEWTELKGGTFTVPGSDVCNIVQVVVYLEGPPPGYDLFIDDVAVTAL
ncbi:MAG TPA: carbohydrate binding domain-containing protein [Polyangiaceae bacterium]|jgi:hypothetical protein|nr:carbohydrate binding domain-containing protein [Polyangiaceae bacterium]